MNKWIVIIGLISGIFNVSAQCDHTQLYPADTVTPIMDWMMIDSCSKAGQYALIHVEEGMYYGFSTRAADGSDITYDSQLTLRKTNGDLIAYNDFFTQPYSFGHEYHHLTTCVVDLAIVFT